jgi:hypothetical protein
LAPEHSHRFPGSLEPTARKKGNSRGFEADS